MTGDQLKAIRVSRNLTREQFAAELGDTSPSTLNKWERNISPVPEWVREKALRKVPLTLPLDALALLLDVAREQNKSFEQLLTIAIHQYLAKSVGEETSGPFKQTAQRSTMAATTVLTDSTEKYRTAKGAQRKAAG